MENPSSVSICAVVNVSTSTKHRPHSAQRHVRRLTCEALDTYAATEHRLGALLGSTVRCKGHRMAITTRHNAARHLSPDSA